MCQQQVLRSLPLQAVYFVTAPPLSPFPALLHCSPATAVVVLPQEAVGKAAAAAAAEGEPPGG